MQFNTFTHKGYGRIYVDLAENIEKVKDIIKELDAFEYGYLPKDFITIHSDYPAVVPTHKFSDMDLDNLTATCWEKGIHIWCFDAQRTEYPS